VNIIDDVLGLPPNNEPDIIPDFIAGIPKTKLAVTA